MESWIGKLEGGIQDMQADARGMRQDLVRMGKRLDSMDKTMTGMLGALGGIKTILQSQSDQLRDLDERVKKLEGAA